MNSSEQNQDTPEPDKKCGQPVPADPNLKKGPARVDRHIADADKRARTGRTDEPVRDTPPAGAWNDTSSD
jgi:hypothetical protein